MKNPTPATTTADTPGSSERLKHSADVGGGEMKGKGREEERVCLTVRKQSLTAIAPASAAAAATKKKKTART